MRSSHSLGGRARRSAILALLTAAGAAAFGAQAASASAQTAAGLAMTWQPNNTMANVFYVGADGQIYNWVWTSSQWLNNALGSGEAAETGTGVATAWVELTQSRTRPLIRSAGLCTTATQATEVPV
jgi:hypothetical protein